MRLMRKLLLPALLLGAVLFGAACEEGGGENKTAHQESERRETTYDALVASEPAHSMTHSPTRKTINFWIDTWNDPSQLAFVYIVNQASEKVGYFVFQGPPVSMCAALTPTYEELKVDVGDADGDVIVPAPGVDGAFYSGGQCNQFYGQEAVTDAYLEFSIGGAQNYIMATQPLDLDLPPLGSAEISDLKIDKSGEYVNP